jgi:spore maturation protein CgeB
MKILLVGGEFCRGSLCDSYLRAFKKLGHEVDYFDEVKEYKSVSKFTGQRYLNRLFEIYFIKLINKKLIQVVCDFIPDLCIIMKGQCISPNSLLEIKAKAKSTLFNINTDNPFNKNRGASSGYVRKSLALFDCYFIWSKPLILRLKEAGARRVGYIPFGFDPIVHYPMAVSWQEKKMFSHDLVFVGNWDREREEWFKGLEGFDLAIWGEDYWQERCKDKFLRERWQKKAMYGEDMSKVLNASKISLNILREQNKGSCNMRTFEAPACKAFVLAEKSLEAGEFFKEGKEAVYFSNPEELREKANYYLKHDKERENIAQAGYQRCIESGYSYLDRAKQVLMAL